MMGENENFQKVLQLGSPQATDNNEFLFKNIVVMHWTHQIALCYQPCHGGFTAKITGSPNVVCMINHTMKDLQRKY